MPTYTKTTTTHVRRCAEVDLGDSVADVELDITNGGSWTPQISWRVRLRGAFPNEISGLVVIADHCTEAAAVDEATRRAEKVARLLGAMDRAARGEFASAVPAEQAANCLQEISQRVAALGDDASVQAWGDFGNWLRSELAQLASAVPAEGRRSRAPETMQLVSIGTLPDLVYEQLDIPFAVPLAVFRLSSEAAARELGAMLYGSAPAGVVAQVMTRGKEL